MQKKISVIVPIYNGEKYLKRCLNSLIHQNFKNIEIICVDDGSGDGSYNIIKEYQKKDSRIIVVKNKGKGVSEARNLGIEKATGDYITFVDCDDFVQEDIYVKMYDCMRKKNVQIVKCRYNRITKKNSKTICLNGEIREYTSNEFLKAVLEGKKNAYVWLLLVESQILKQKKISFESSLNIMEDKAFYVDLLKNVDTIVEINDNLYNYYIREDSSIRNVDKVYERVFEIIKASNVIEKKIGDNIEFQKVMYACNTIIIIEQICMLYISKVEFDIENIKNNSFFNKMILNIDKKIMRYDRRILFYLFAKRKTYLMIKYYRLIKYLKKMR